jgi:hypothetical protein
MLGTVLEIAGAPGDPVEGSDVTLLCSVSYPSIKDPPEWFYYANGNYHQLTTNKTNGNATSPNYPAIEYDKSNAGKRQYFRMATLTSKWTRLKINLQILTKRKDNGPRSFSTRANCTCLTSP